MMNLKLTKFFNETVHAPVRHVQVSHIMRITLFVGIVAVAAAALMGCDEDPGSGGSDGGHGYTCANGVANPNPTGIGRSVEVCWGCNPGYELGHTLCERIEDVPRAYSCANGTPIDGEPVIDDEQRCASCDDEYHLDGIECVENAYTCANGDAAIADADDDAIDPLTTHNLQQCTACDSGYTLNNVTNLCDGSSYLCENGTPRDESPIEGESNARCVACLEGYVLENNACRPAVYTCDNGTATSGTPGAITDVVSCAQCDSGYTMSDIDGSCFMFGARATEHDVDTSTNSNVGSSTHFDYGNDNPNPTGIWGSGMTRWVTDGVSGVLNFYQHQVTGRPYRYNIDTIEGNPYRGITLRYFPTVYQGIGRGIIVPDHSKEIDVDRGRYGVWSDGTTVWVSASADVIHAYNIASGEEDIHKHIRIDGQLRGLWGANGILWIAQDGGGDRDYIAAWHLERHERVHSGDFNTLNAAGNNGVSGIWSDGETMWAADYEDGIIYAYNFATKQRDDRKDIVTDTNTDTITDTNNRNSCPLGMWSDGQILWVIDCNFKQPIGIDEYDRSLASTYTYNENVLTAYRIQ